MRVDHVLLITYFLDFFYCPFLYTESVKVKIKFPRLKARVPDMILVLSSR